MLENLKSRWRNWSFPYWSRADAGLESVEPTPEPEPEPVREVRYKACRVVRYKYFNGHSELYHECAGQRPAPPSKDVRAVLTTTHWIAQ